MERSEKRLKIVTIVNIILAASVLPVLFYLQDMIWQIIIHLPDIIATPLKFLYNIVGGVCYGIFLAVFIPYYCLVGYIIDIFAVIYAVVLMRKCKRNALPLKQPKKYFLINLGMLILHFLSMPLVCGIIVCVMAANF
jgi:hypothetical protein